MESSAGRIPAAEVGTLAELWSVAIGRRDLYREDERGLERLTTVPLLLLHGRRAAVFADRHLAEAVADALRRRFPFARVLRYPGGPADARVIDPPGAADLLRAYGMVPLDEPLPPGVRALLRWIGPPGQASPPQPGPPPVPAGWHALAVRFIAHALARREVHPGRALAALATLGTPEAVDFLVWALAADDLEFQAKYGRLAAEALRALPHLPPPAAAAVARRVLEGAEHVFPPRVRQVCAQRLRAPGGEAAPRGRRPPGRAR